MTLRILLTGVLIVWTCGLGGCREVEFSGEKRDRDERSRDQAPDGEGGPGGTSGGTQGGDPKGDSSGSGGPGRGCGAVAAARSGPDPRSGAADGPPPNGTVDGPRYYLGGGAARGRAAEGDDPAEGEDDYLLRDSVDAASNCGASSGGGSHAGGGTGGSGSGSAGGTGAGGGSGSSGDGTEDGDGAAPADDGGGGDAQVDETGCVDGDRLKARFAKDAQSCLESGRIYDFGGKACSALKAATKFSCTWTGVLDAVTALGLTTPQVKLKSWRDGGGKLVACGEKDGGLVVQVVKSGTATLGKSCAATAKTAVLTACYETSSSVTPGQSEEQAVRACF